MHPRARTAQTKQKTQSVPMLTSCASASMSTSSASRPALTPVTSVALTGVPRLGCTRANQAGSSPSRAIVM